MRAPRPAIVPAVLVVILLCGIQGAPRARGSGERTPPAPTEDRPAANGSGAIGADTGSADEAAGVLAGLIQQKKYAEAERQARALLAGIEKREGPDSLRAGLFAGLLAEILYRGTKRGGDEARSLAARAVAIRGAFAGPAAAPARELLLNLARIMVTHGDPDGARELHDGAVGRWEGEPSAEGAPLAAVWGDYGRLMLDEGEPAEAARALERSLAIRRDMLPEGEDQYVAMLEDLARAEMDLGRTTRSRQRLVAALSIRKRSRGPDDPDVARLHGEVASIYSVEGNAARSLGHALRAERIARRVFLGSGGVSGIGAAIRYERVRASSIDRALSLLAAGGSPGDDRTTMVRKVWDEVIRSRGLVLDRLAAGGGAAREDAAPYDRIGGPDIGLARIASALPPRSALVAFVEYGRTAETSPGGDGAPAAQEVAASTGPYLMAFVAAAGRAAPAAVPLGPAEAIEPLIARHREIALMVPGDRPGIDDVAERVHREAGLRLREAIWDPLVPHMGGAERLFIVPDGALTLVAFGTLPDGGDRYLIETGPLLHHLTAERDLVRPPRPVLGEGGLLAIGGPDFDAEIPMASAGTAAARGASCDAAGRVRFDPLPPAKREAEAVADLWRKSGRADKKDPPASVLLTGKAATEGALASAAAGRSVLHLATREFLAPAECLSILDAARGRAPSIAPDGDGPAVSGADSPLLLSGLALAGANRRIEGGASDGILSAEEIARLDLSAAIWVVLSTTGPEGSGSRAGERVRTLRRAFESAGAGTVIMNLWGVRDDGAAWAWLSRLYEARRSGLRTPEALRRASLETLNERRASGGTLLPLDWGAFVATGDWR